MDDQQRSADLLQGAAAVACASCRRLKMRCIGAAHPPCARCLKSNRECVVKLPNRTQQRAASRTQASSLLESRPSPVIGHSPTTSVPLTVSQTTQAQEPSYRSTSARQTSPLTLPLLPSIYSSSPIAIATTNVSGSESPSSSVTTSCSAPLLALADSVIVDLVEFFLQKLIFYAPVLSLEPLDDVDILITRQRPLAYAMAFVASTLSVGYGSTRLALFPYMVKLLEQANDLPGSTQEESWALLQALAVLYSYPKVALAPGHVGEKQLSFWAVKSAVEACAMQLSLHHSVEDLKGVMGTPDSNVSASLPFRRTFYWIWLFVKSRHHSIITRTPPTIQNDSTIKSTLDLMPGISPSPAVWRVLAEAALYHKWDQAACSDKGLAEWWCVPSNTKDIGALTELLENAENLLQEWSSTWLQSDETRTPAIHESNLSDPSIFANTITAFMGTLTHFSILSFSAPIVSHQLIARLGIAVFPSTTGHSRELSAFLNCVLKSADAASQCCDIIIQLKPAARETLRYTPDPGLTMIALCCLHLIYAYNMSPDNPTLRRYIAKAEQVAYLMLDLRTGYNSCPRIYGEYVLCQLRSATRGSTVSTVSTKGLNEDHDMTNLELDGLIGLQDSHRWSQLGHMTDINTPLDFLFPTALSNDAWQATEQHSDTNFPSSHELLDVFNLYPEPLQHDSAESL